jgi:hypothetical protein
VQVGAAQPGPADLHDDVERPGDFGRWDLVEFQRGVEGVQSCCLHGGLPSVLARIPADRCQSHWPPSATSGQPSLILGGVDTTPDQADEAAATASAL